jgi:hypothetical protein
MFFFNPPQRVSSTLPTFILFFIFIFILIKKVILENIPEMGYDRLNEKD